LGRTPVSALLRRTPTGSHQTCSWLTRVCCATAHHIRVRGLLGALLCVSLAMGPVHSRAESTTDPDGTVHITSLVVPLSDFLSQEASSALRNRSPFSFNPPILDADIATVRASAEKNYKVVADRMLRRYPVKIDAQEMAGVHTDIVIPKDGVSARNRERVLVNLHGGGFFLGAGSGALVESIPVASVAKIKVVTVDYRMAPEHKFPAGNEDVAAVYRELLKQYRPSSIGIYGCSAGGTLTAQVVAWFHKQRMPRPGAIGIFGASGIRGSHGDSTYLAPALVHSPQTGPLRHGSYFDDVPLDDPLVSPARDLDVLARFPPTLLINSTRHPSVSGALYTFAGDAAAGADAALPLARSGAGCSVHTDADDGDSVSTGARLFEAV